MTLRSLMIVPLLGAALAFGQDEEGKSSKEPIWRRAMNAAERSIERGDKKRARGLHVYRAARATTVQYARE